MASSPSGFDYRPLRAGIRRFGYAFTRNASDTSDAPNLVISPVSLEVALAMMREGSSGATAAAMDRALGFPTDRRVAFDALIRALQDSGDGNTLNIGNALFLDRQYAVRQSYLHTLAEWYGTGLYQTNFPAPALDDINAYVSNETHGRIPHLVDSLSDDDVMALVNTVYLDATWRDPFSKYETATREFHTGTDATVKVKTMHRLGDLDVYVGSDWTALRLPYRGGELTMEVLLPAQNTDPVSLLRPSVLHQVDERHSTYYGELWLPRWDISSTIRSPIDVLKALGMTDTFDGQGDFAGITTDPSLAIDQILHQADIEVGERGTVAVAATGAINEAISAPPPPTITMRFDHPFAFALLNNVTGVPVFEGIVSDPSSVGSSS